MTWLHIDRPLQLAQAPQWNVDSGQSVCRQANDFIAIAALMARFQGLLEYFGERRSASGQTEARLKSAFSGFAHVHRPDFEGQKRVRFDPFATPSANDRYLRRTASQDRREPNDASQFAVNPAQPRSLLGFGLFGQLQSVFYLDTEIANRAF
jgi:hypothetical protein